MRVLFLTHSFPRHPGDVAGAFILRLATALANEDVAVKVIAPATASVPHEDVMDGIPIHRFRYSPRALETLAYEGNMATQVKESWSAKLALVALLGAELQAALSELRRERYDVVHAHWWFPNGVAGVAAARWAALPLVTTLHGSDVRLGRAIRAARPAMRQVLRRSARVTAVSRWLAEEAQQVAGGELPVVAPMPVATGLFTPDSSTPRDETLLFVGRLTRQKGVDLLLRALSSLPDSITLDIVGDGEERAALLALAGSLGVERRVRWYGARPASELARFYRRAAALVIPSTEEGLGLVAVEAQLCETPVIAFASGGVVDVIRGGETGILVGERTPDALARAIARLLETPDRGAALGRQGAARARAAFAADKVAQRYADIYREAIARAAR
ncbi:MAG TPA: glycosyltransferase [Gemmatimonadaceae bacterium]